MQSSESDALLASYLRFLNRKRDGSIAEVAAEFHETVTTRLLDDSYGVEHVNAILDDLLAVVRATMKRDLSMTNHSCLLYTSPSPRDRTRSRMPSSA